MTEAKHAYMSLAATIVVCSIATFFWKHRASNAQGESNGNELVVELLPIEQTMAMGGGENNLSTLTWFRGDYNQAKKCIQKRMEEILKANPWLGGRIVKRSGTFALVYSYDSSSQVADNHFECRENELSRDIPLDQLGASLSHLLLRNGPMQPLWKVSILPCHQSPSTFFALVCSMSHIIADGYTYYKIQNMLTFAEPVTSLEVERILTTQEQQIQAMGGKSEYSVLQSAGFIVCMFRGVFQSMLFGPKPTTRIYLVEEKGIKEAKQKATGNGVSFVSSNDVLTSWFLTNCGCQYGMMALNFRGRLHGHSNQHAGNYENVLFYNRSDSATPSLIRKSLKLLQRVVTNDRMPSLYEMAVGGSFAIATNWSSFARPTCLEHCEEEMHVPLYNFSSMLPLTLAIMLIFRAGPHGLAVLVAGTPNQITGLQDTPFLSEQVL